MLKGLAVFILGLLSSSWLLTKTWHFNYGPYLSRKVYTALTKEQTFTVEELAQFDGTDPKKPIYLSIVGKVYDVTPGKDYYGPGGSYAFFAGRDATRSYITGCFKTHLTHDMRGITPEQMKSLKQWTDLFAGKYRQIGRMLLPKIDPESPIPEPCDE